jgi:flagellin
MPTFNTNIDALKAQHALTSNNLNLSRSVAQLSSGLRVNSAADDAASLAIGSQMSAKILSLNQAVRNANDGISMVQTADGATLVMTNLLVRMRELAIQAASDTYGDTDRAAMNTEFGELKSAVNGIIENTGWNGQKLLDGSVASATYQVGARGEATEGVSVDFADWASGGANELKVLTATGLTTRPDAQTAMGDLEDDLATINAQRASWGAAMNRLSHAADSSANVAMNLSTSKSQLLDADYAKATADLARAQIIQAAGTAMLSQANQQGVMVLHLLS